MDILKDFGIQPFLLSAQIVNFLVLLYLLKRILYKPILKVLDERKSRISQSLKDAEEIEKQLLKTEEDREKRLKQATNEARAIIEEATKTANQIIQEARVKAGKDIEQIIARNEQVMKLEREKLHQQIRLELADLIMISLQRVIGRVLDKKDQKELVERSIKELV